MKRIDVLLAEKGLAKSRTAATVYINEKRVTVNGKTVLKPHESFDEDAEICVDYPEISFVSRGGLKLAGALSAFGVSPAGKICIDIGASTGGFTDCLLKNGAIKVYAVDSGTLQLDESLRSDCRVVCMENVNARYIQKEDLDEIPTLAVMDVSFISQTLIYRALASILESGSEMITLVKPQFELEKSKLGKNGIVKDPNGKKAKEIKEKIEKESKAEGFALIGWTDSPIKGGDGNTEYLARFVRL